MVVVRRHVMSNVALLADPGRITEARRRSASLGVRTVLDGPTMIDQRKEVGKGTIVGEVTHLSSPTANLHLNHVRTVRLVVVARIVCESKARLIERHILSDAGVISPNNVTDQEVRSLTLGSASEVGIDRIEATP